MPNQTDRAPVNATHLIRTETLHLAELQVRELVQTPLEERFNRLARMTQRALGTRVAAISFLDSDGEWFKAVTGWNVTRLPPDRSLAASLVTGGDTVAVPDTLQDERVQYHPLVEGSPRFRFCAMQPLVDRFENTIGSVAVYDTEPRAVTADMLEAIRDAGELAQRELLVHNMGGIQRKLLEKLDSSRREALLDELTRLWNRRGGLLLLEQALEGVRNGDEALGVCVVDIDDFKLINDQFGHAMGDVVLRNIAAAIVSAVRPSDIACRLAGDEFLLVVPNVDSDQLSGIMDRVRVRVQALIIRARAASVRVTVSVGGALASQGYEGGADDLVHAADEAMYETKRSKSECRTATAGT
jgi:diguanylate cyclase (GGDEF)-like protein